MDWNDKSRNIPQSPEAETLRGRNTFGYHTSYMNRTFKPVLFNNPFGTGKVPAIFQSVQPLRTGVPFRSNFFIPQ